MKKQQNKLTYCPLCYADLPPNHKLRKELELINKRIKRSHRSIKS